MSKKYTTNFLEDTNGSTGSANQVLVSTAAGVDWVDGSGSGIIGGPYLKDTTDTFTGSLTIVGDIRGSGQQLILNAGESYSYATGQTNEYVYANAEQGLEVSSSPDNWATGWAGRNTTRIGKADGSSTFPGALTWSGGGSVESNTAYDNSVTAISDSGTSTTTITLTQQDGGTLSTSFSNPQGTVTGATSGNVNTITVSSSSTSPVVTPVTGAVSSGSTNLATGAQIQTAINTATTGVLSYQGTWNASTNSPALASGVGTPGYYYIVSVAGSTNLDGITDWAVGDWAVFSDLATDAWQKIDNTQVGNVTGSGANQRLAFWNSTSNIASDDELTWDGVNLNIGTYAGTGDCELRLFGSTPNNSFSTLKTTNGNLHIDSDDGHNIYLNYYTGGSTSNIVFGNGNGGASGATVSNTGIITATGGNSTEWNTAYDNQITTFTDSGTSTVTLTLTQQDGGTLSTSFSVPQGTVTGGPYLPLAGGSSVGQAMTGTLHGPGATFYVSGNNSSNLKVGDGYFRMEMGRSSIQARVIGVSGAASSLNLNPNGGDVLFTGSGNVGIGTTDPTADLHVQGSSATEVPIIRSGGFGNSGSKLELAETLVSGNMTYGFSFFNDGNSSNTLQIKSHNNSTAGVTAITINRTNALTTFSTVPIVGTRTAGDNTTYAASTAFVTAAITAAAPTVNDGTLTMTTTTGLDGGATFTANQSGNSAFAVSLDLSELADMTQTMVGSDEFIVLDNSAERRKAASEIGLSIFDNDAGFTSNTGDITAVVAGDYLTGGGTSGSVTLNGDNAKLAHIVDSSNGSVTAGWITVALASTGRRAGEIYVTDGESSDHSYIRIEWMRSYADSNFTVINCGGHANRIQGVRVLEQTSDVTYGPKYLQVKVTATSNYYVIITAPGTIPNYSDFTAVTPVLENTKTGYQLTGAQLEDLQNSSVGTDEGITVGGDLFVNGGDIVLGGTGRIQGVDTVSATTDAANKAYVDAHGGGLGPFLPIANPTFTGTLTGPAATITGNTLLGNSNGDYVHVNDRLFVGATDSGNSEFWFGEGTTGDVNYGAHWHWDSGYTHKWFTVNNSTETLMMSYATNDLTKVQWFRNFDMNNNKITELATPTATTDAANKAYVDAHPAGTVTGTGLSAKVAVWTNTTNIIDGPITFSSNDATFAGNLYIPNVIYHSGDTDTYLQFHAANQFRIVTGGTEMLEVNDTYVQLGADLNANNKQLINVEDIGLNDRIYHDGDDDTYMQFHNANQWRVVTGGSERLEVNNTYTKVNSGNFVVNNNIGVGTLSPTSPIGSTRYINVKSTGNGEIILDHTDAGTASDLGLYSWARNADHLAHIKATCDGSTSAAFISFHAQPSGGSFANATSNEKMRIKSNGYVGIGTTSPDLKLDIVSGTNNGIRISATDTTSNWRDISIRSYVSEAQANAFGDTGSYIYTSSPAGTTTDTPFSYYGATVIQGRDNGNGGLAVRLGNGGGLATRMWIGATGVTVFSNTVTATNFILSSDERLKENIEKACDNRIKADWKTFELKTDKGQKRYGVIAQELEKTNPEFVREDTQGFKSVAYIDLLIAKIAELEARLEKLEK